MKRFKYDVVKLIEGVRDRPCLWNKTIENYKDRVERKVAWIEIFNMLDERYEEMSSEDKRLLSEMVLSKWTNIRDTFVKSLKSRAGKTKKQYVLYDHLKFLLQIIPESERQEQDNLGYNSYNEPTEDQSSFMKEPAEDHSSFIKEPAEVQSSFMRDEIAVGVEPPNFLTKKPKDYTIFYDDSDNDTVSTEEAPISRSSKRKKSKKESTKDAEFTQTNIDFVSMDDPRIMNEDEAFFASLLPTIVKYSEDERLEFRIEVLALMKRIKDKRNSVF